MRRFHVVVNARLCHWIYMKKSAWLEDNGGVRGLTNPRGYDVERLVKARASPRYIFDIVKHIIVELGGFFFVVETITPIHAQSSKSFL